MKIAKTALLCAFLGIAAATAARANYEYDWTGGAAGYSGTIILDTNSSNNGSLADIVFAQITTPQTTYVFDPAKVFIQGPFQWNSTQITNMWIDWTSGTTILGFGENWNGHGQNLLGSRSAAGVEYSDFTGSWVAGQGQVRVPDAASTGLLLGLGLASLAFWKKRKSMPA